MSTGSRVLFSLSGVTDANGTATLSSPSITQWSTLTVFATLSSGQGAWTAYVSGSNTNPTNPFGVAVGSSVTAGPVDIAPNEYLVVNVIGANPNTTITGTVFGVQNVNPNTLDARTMSGAVSAVNVNGPIGTYNLQENLGTITVNPTSPSTGFSQTYTLPTNFEAQSLILLCTGNWAPSGGTGGELAVTGNQSNINYAFLYPPNFTVQPVNLTSGVGTNFVNISSGADTQVIVSGIGPSTGTGLTVEVIASSELQLQEVDLTTINGTVLSRGQDIGAGGTSSIPVVPAQFYAPAPWQAPNSLYAKFQTWATGYTTILAAPSSPFFYRLFWYSVSLSAAGGPIFIATEDSAGTQSQISPSQSTVGSVQGNALGLSLGVGNSITVGNSQTAGLAATIILAYTETDY